MKNRTFIITVTDLATDLGDFGEQDVETAFKLAYPYMFGNYGNGPKRELTVRQEET